MDALTLWLMRPEAPDVPLTLEERLNRPAWQARAACRGQGADDWVTSSRRESAYRAEKRVCMSCPVREPCLSYALAHPELVGCWGGTGEAERQRMRRALDQRPSEHAVS